MITMGIICIEDGCMQRRQLWEIFGFSLSIYIIFGGKESLHGEVLKGTNSLMCEVVERRMARNMPE